MPGPGTWSPGDVLTADDLNDIGTWVSYTPVLKQSVNRSCTINYANYSLINKLCIANVSLTCTTTGTASTVISVTAPVSMQTNQENLGSGYFFDSSANDMILVQVDRLNSTELTFVADSSTTSTLGATPNITLGNGDVISFTIAFEAA